VQELEKLTTPVDSKLTTTVTTEESKFKT